MRTGRWLSKLVVTFVIALGVFITVEYKGLLPWATLPVILRK